MPWVDENGQPVDEATAKRAEALSSAQDRVQTSKQNTGAPPQLPEGGFLQSLMGPLGWSGRGFGTAPKGTTYSEDPTAPSVGRAVGDVLGVKGIMRAPGAISKAKNLLFPKETRPQLVEKAAGQAIEKHLGIPGDVLDRNYSQAVPEAYQAAEKGAGTRAQPVMDAIDKALTSERGMANPNPSVAGRLKTTKVPAQQSPVLNASGSPASATPASSTSSWEGGVLQNLKDKFAKNPNINAKDLIDEKQRLTRLALGYEKSARPEGKQIAASLRNVVSRIDELAEASGNEELRTAQSQAGKYGAAPSIRKALTAGEPGKAIRDLVDKNPEILRRAGLNQATAQSLFNEADQIAAIPDPQAKAIAARKFLGKVAGGGMLGYMFHRYLYHKMFGGEGGVTSGY